MLKQLHISGGKLVEGNDRAEVCVYVAPDETERKCLVEQVRIDEHTLNSSLDPDELSRLEFEPEHTAMIFKRPKRYLAEDSFLFKVASIGIFVFKERIVIVVSEDAPLFDGKLPAKIQSPYDVLLRLFFCSISHFVEHLKGINVLSSELESRIGTSMKNTYLLNLFTLEKGLVYYLNAIHTNGVLLEKLKSNTAKIGFTLEQLEFLDDIIIENNQCARQAEVYAQVLASLMDARVSIVANNLNIRIKALTLITIALMLPMLVVSTFSMNVRIPLAQLGYAFWIIIAMGLISSSFFGIMWWRRRW